MQKPDWMEEFPGAITVTDDEGKIIYMNKKAAQTFEAEGGLALIGRNIMDCHRLESQEKIKKILESGKPNIYTIEKKGQKKLIFQTVWTEAGRVRGLVELSLEIPTAMPHFVRD
ncbi:MAG: PAS domain S-box protein [Candidatus Saccharicenans sp.]|jgi:PAS domain S-box-containing protein|nr:PAS domain S-box protein [Candidatus Saccharicenans sp.]MDH7575987.1 PAS domain S-box protein [Candidatus Saccharicenans sp.]